MVPPTRTRSPTETPTALSSRRFFTEEFDAELGTDWLMNINGPSAAQYKDTVTTEFSNSRLHIELPHAGLYLYYYFLGSDYDNVRIDLRAENVGESFGSVSLVCRASTAGWYEWSIRSDGLWDLWAFTDKYNLLYNGGSTALRPGKEANEYSMICNDNQISLFINEEEMNTSPVTDNRYRLQDGVVGFNVSSLRQFTPVVVDVDWFEISEP
jgi:hypothetical protein